MAKRRYEAIELNEKSFTLDTAETTSEYELTRQNIYDAYNKPSADKVETYTDWSRWFYENDGYCSVLASNSYTFSIEGYVTDKATGKRYHCYITKAHNRCEEVAA